MLITGSSPSAPRSILSIVQSALEAGAPAIQLRAKKARARDMAELGRRLRELTKAADALLLVNDRYDVARAVAADGVHLGPEDVPVSALRRIAPKGFLIGASADQPSAAQRLVSEGADYIGCGAIYPTLNKLDAGPTIGLAGLQAVVDAVEVPVLGIGGIDADGARKIATRTSAAGIAAIGSIMDADDPGSEVSALLSPFRTYDYKGAANRPT
ncbi:MAG TPA: thiamine phosphate synthase [Gemmatimonadetes bacterium]|jgi:thiamine-phosphate pyrophosphorylase|nr:thiamine phosphate synthase [Gemmatimonadota bacterium]HCK59757.1 thiamine phosphate synthase [Gemmatimonadota bacterium]HCW77587.1 thiamine phosphate synthase [Gemmatimonadota bacterium]